MKLVPPVAYQGAKQRIAGPILDEIKPAADAYFYDICCGSGAVSVELVNRGHDPKLIRMVDAGPWGVFWEMVGKGTFDIDRFAQYCADVPSNPAKIKAHLDKLASQPVGEDLAYVFLLLQGGAFGGKAIRIKDGKWNNCNFRNYWQPTATSKTRRPVNPMMPMPATILWRTRAICQWMKGIQGYHLDALNFFPGEPGVVYVDPPYQGTYGYGNDLNPVKYAKLIGRDCFVSEGLKLGDRAVMISAGRSQGGIRGISRPLNEEWLSVVEGR